MKDGENIVVSLLFDEMNIMKGIFFDGKQYTGTVDFGGELPSYQSHDSSELACDALVFMIVAVNNNWKVPVGYFLIKSLSAEGTFNFSMILSFS